MSEKRRGALTPSGRKLIPSTGRPASGDELAPGAFGPRRLRHDIQHELATISLLASLLDTAQDVGGSNRLRAKQLLREIQWLGELLLAYDEARAAPATVRWSPPAERLRVDILAREVCAALRLTSPARAHISATEVTTYANRLSLWRALRNLMGNAFRASGPQGQVEVRVAVEGHSAVVQIDDDGPGFGAGPAGLASQGLGIVRGIVAECGGDLEVSSSDMGGARVRLLLPAVPGPADGRMGEPSRAHTGL